MKDFAQLLKENRKKAGLTQEELADKLDITRATIISWEKGVTAPDGKELKSLNKLFDNDFTMFHVERGMSNSDDKIPFYDTVAVGGHALLADQNAIGQPSEMINPGTFLKSATGALRVYGHSMYPKYPSGCIVAFKASSTAIPAVIIWGEDYVIELEDRRIIKKVDKGETKDSIKAVSLNGTNGDKVKYQYDPIDIQLKDIKRMYMVLGKIELEASI